MKKIFYASLVFLLGTSFANSAKAQIVTPPVPQYGITFYENNFGDLSHVIATFTSSAPQYNYTNPWYNLGLNTVANFKNYQLHQTGSSNSINDRARSAIINTTGPITFKIYDSPSASTGDDYVIVSIKTAVSNYYLDTLEKNYNDSNAQVTFYHHNGLDGKVSSLVITQ